MYRRARDECAKGIRPGRPTVGAQPERQRTVYKTRAGAGARGRRMWGDRQVLPVDLEHEQTTGVVAELQKQLTLVEVMGTNLALNG